MERSNNQNIAYATKGKATDVIESVKLNRNKMEKKLELIGMINETINTLTFVQTAIIADDNYRVDAFTTHSLRDLRIFKETYVEYLTELEQLNTEK